MNPLPIPDAALENHVAILGKTGSGKSNAAKAIAELLLSRDKRVCAVDPTGTWWGLRLDAKGKKPSGFPLAIFGGAHGDLPLEAAHGATIAEAIGTSSTSAILDVRGMTVAARTRFFTDFAEGLIRTNRGELTLMLDEAHVFAPQGGAGIGGGTPAMLHAANNLVALGRGVGLRIVLISQRPAKLHKDSLTQVETLVAMKLMAPQDRDAIREWVKDQADATKGAEIIASLPGLQKGEAWIWAPELGLLKRERFPLVATFDSGRPRPDIAPPKLKPIDMGEITAKLQEVGEQALANDPARLKKRIAELEKQVATISAASTEDAKNIAPSAEELGAAVRHGWERGVEDALRFAGETMASRYEEEIADARDALTGWETARDEVRSGAWALKLADQIVPSRGPAAEAEKPTSVALRPAQPKSKAAPNRQPSVGAATPDGAADAGLTPAKRRIIVALRQCEAMGKGAPAREQVAWLAGVSPKSSGFANNLGALRSAGLIDYPAGGTVALTEAGGAIEPPQPAPTHADLMALIKGLIPAATFRILQWAAQAYPGEVSRAELAEGVGVSAASSGYANNLGRLKSLGLIYYPRQGFVKAAEVLWP